ncbi:MAG: hypothetical protein ACRDAM_10340 [Casimicrobium sp.]
MEKVPPHDPAHYWKIASKALAEEQLHNLRNLREIDGMRALNRLTLGTSVRRAAGIEKPSDMIYLAELFAKAYGSRV